MKDWPRWRWFWREVGDCADRLQQQAEGMELSPYLTVILPFDMEGRRECCASCTARLRRRNVVEPDPETGFPTRYVRYICPLGCEYPMPPGRALS